MPPSPLSAEEKALWRRVTRDVRRLSEPVAPGIADDVADRPPQIRAGPEAIPTKPAALRAPPPLGTLDGTWDRKLRRGLTDPDLTIDLHGHSLASAHRTLDAALDRAAAGDVRLMLVITGKPPRGNAQRGAIRAQIGDWLGASRHAGRIAALRGAHPRHGGEGALYLVLRRSGARGGERIP